MAHRSTAFDTSFHQWTGTSRDTERERLTAPRKVTREDQAEKSALVWTRHPETGWDFESRADVDARDAAYADPNEAAEEAAYAAERAKDVAK